MSGSGRRWSSWSYISQWAGPPQSERQLKIIQARVEMATCPQAKVRLAAMVTIATWSILTLSLWMFISACSPRYSLIFNLYLRWAEMEKILEAINIVSTTTRATCSFSVYTWLEHCSSLHWGFSTLWSSRSSWSWSPQLEDLLLQPLLPLHRLLLTHLQGLQVYKWWDFDIF